MTYAALTAAWALPCNGPTVQRVPRLALLAATTIVVRIAFLLRHRIDSDEPQHLHVAWGWTQGLVQYRDVFDNHLPLLHLLLAPVMSLVPESSAAFTIARLAMLPFAIGAAWLLYLFARPRFGERTATLAALAFSVMPIWLPKSVEVRNDTLWIFFWLAALALLARSDELRVASGEGFPARRGSPGNSPLATRNPHSHFFLAGLALSLSLLASIKAVPLVLAHLLALGAWPRGVSVRSAAHLVLGVTVPLLALTVWLDSIGALEAMLENTILFNAATPISAARRIGGMVAFVFVAPALVRTRRRTGHLTRFALWYSALLLCFWPILTPRDFLPLVPLGALAIATYWRASAVALIVATTLASVVYARLWRPRDTSRERFVDAVVHATRPGDFVFDLKGDAVFRRRAVYYIYEDVGRALTANGTIADTGPEQIVATRCCAAIADSPHIPPRTRAFLNQHFAGNGPLRLCGPSAWWRTQEGFP